MRQRIKRGWRSRSKILVCVLIICMLVSLLPTSLLPMQQALAVESLETQHTRPMDGPQHSSPGDGFQDVHPADWYYDAVSYVQRNNIFNGTGEDTFSPLGTMTRAMYVTALGRMAGVEVSEYATSTFADVPQGEWYAPYVAWAAQIGVTAGTGNGNFSPDVIVTREQMATMIVRYFDIFQIPYQSDTPPVTTTPADIGDVSSWAVDAVVKLWQAGLFIGDQDGNFNPQHLATRGEAAVTFMRSHEVVETWRVQDEETLTPIPESEDSDNGDDNRDGDHVGGGSTIVYEYTVTFESNEGTAVTGQKIGSGSQAEEPEAPIKEGYTFGGWYSDSSLSIPYDFTARVNQNITLYAKWMINSYTVSFDSNGGASVSSQTVNYGDRATEPTAPMLEGFTFAGWYGDSDLTNAYIFSTAVTGDITLYAKWTIDVYTVSFDSNGGSPVSSEPVDHGNNATEPTAPTRVGYTFGGWYSDSDHTVAYDFATPVTANITLYARWIADYTVTFDSDGGTVVAARTVSEGDKLVDLPVPTKEGYIFRGWFTDSDYTHIFTENSKVTADMTLYAKYMEHIIQATRYTPSYSVLDVAPSFSITVLDESKAMTASEVLDHITFEDISKPNSQGIIVTGEDGRYEISSAAEDGEFTEGNTYQLTLNDDRLTFEDLDETTRIYVFSVAKQEALTVPLNPDMIYLPFADVQNMTLDGETVDSPAISIISTTVSGSENGLGAANSGSGTFTYTGSAVLQLGDVVVIYEGVRPDLRTVDSDGLDDGDIAYVEIASINGTTYTYRHADTSQVLFRPDILPVSVNADQDGDPSNNSITVERIVMDYSDSLYEPYGLSQLTTVDVGDFIGFYSGTFDDAGSSVTGYGRITSVVDAAEMMIITYTEVAIDDIEHAFNIYTQQAVDGDLLLTDEDIAMLEGQLEQQAMASGFVDQAVGYLTELAMETKSFKSYDVSIASASKVSVHNLTVVASVSRSPRHIPGLDHGVSATLQVGADIVIDLNEESTLVIHLTGTFLQEIGLSINVNGEVQGHWLTKYIWPIGDIPYWYVIDDYVVTASMDAYTYTGIQIDAEIATVKKNKLEETLLDWGNSKTSGKLGYVLDIANEIQAVMDGIQDTEVDTEYLKAQYKEMLSNETEWVPLIEKKLLEKSFRVALGAVEVAFEADFVVHANANLSLGIDFNYKTANRYSATLYVFEATGTSNTVSLPGDEDYEFTFYVMGTLGLKAGVRMELKAGLGSVKLNSVGLAAEPGAYVQLWGYFYYQLIQQNMEQITRAAGALLVEMGLYLEIKLGAQLGDGLVEGNVPVYEDSWPLYTVGSEIIVDDFAYPQDEALGINLSGRATSMVLPDSLFTMSTFNLKSGETGTATYTDILPYFDIHVDNPSFRFDPTTRTIEVVDPNLTVAEGNVVITWKGAPLTFMYEPVKRTIPLLWLSREGDYTLQLEPQNGSMTLVSSLAYNAPVHVTTPDYPGYTFVGWYSEPTGGIEVTVPSHMPAEDITLYAHWVANTDTPYTVQHYWVDPNARQTPTLVHTETRTGTTDTEILISSNIYSAEGYTAGSVNSVYHIKGDGSTVVKIEYFPTNRTMTFDWGFVGAPTSSITDQFGKNIAKRLPLPSREGYVFTGWEPEVPSILPKVNTTYTAQWEAREDTPYQIVYLQQNIASNTYTVVDKELYRGTTDGIANVTADMERTFEGFMLDKTVPDTVLSANIAGDGSTVLKLYYKRDTHKLTINYDAPGMNNREVEVPYGATTGLHLGTPTRTGYTFAGWSPAPPERMPASDLEVTAQWSLNTYTVSFDSGGGTAIDVQTVGYGLTADEPLAPMLGGYTFGGWYSDPEYTRPYDFETLITNNITLYAKWLVRYTVSFDTGDGSPVPNQTVNEGDKVTPPDQPTWEGYVFSGWYLDDSFTIPYDFATDVVTSSLILYAKWIEEVKITYTVSFDTGGGSPVEDQTVSEGAVAQRPADPARQGYTFEGWYSDSSLTNPYSFNEAVTDHITLYALWEAIRYTVSFNSNGGTLLPEQTVEYGSRAVPPTEPTLEGHAFAGWFQDISFTNAYDFDATVTADFTLYAKWVAVYTVSFESNGGTEIPSQTVEYGDTAQEPVVPTNAGYSFGGWYIDSELTQAYSFATPVTSNIILYAQWTIDSYTVTFDSNGGSIVASRTVNPGEQVTIPEVPSWDGYMFEGWYTDMTWTTRYDFASPVTSDITLYAKWTLSPWRQIGNLMHNTITEQSDIVYDSAGTPYLAYVKNDYTPDYYNLAGQSVYLKKYENGSWQDVGIPSDLDELDTTYFNFYMVLAFDSQDNLYWVLYGDEDLVVYKLARNTGTWQHIGTLGFDNSYEFPTSIAVDNSDHVYVAYTRNDTFTIVIESYNGSTWETVNGLDTFPGNSNYPTIAFDQNNILYMLYSPYEDGYQQRLAKYENGVWEDITAASFLNAEQAALAIGPDNMPYVAYGIGNQLTVTKYRSGTWETVGDTGSVEVSSSSDSLSISIDNYGAIYVAYADHARDNRLSVIKYEGEWSTLGNGGFSLGKPIYLKISIDLDGHVHVNYIDETNTPEEAWMSEDGELIIKKYTP